MVQKDANFILSFYIIVHNFNNELKMDVEMEIYVCIHVPTLMLSVSSSATYNGVEIAYLKEKFKE